MPRLSGLRRLYGLAAETEAEAEAPPKPFRALVRGLYVVAIALGLWYGYAFGTRIGGVLLGLVVAFNGALFASILVGAVVDRTLQRKPPSGNGGA